MGLFLSSGAAARPSLFFLLSSLSSFFAFLALSFVRPRRRLSSAPTARCQSGRAQRQSRTARFSAPPGRALLFLDVTLPTCRYGCVRLVFRFAGCLRLCL